MSLKYFNRFIAFVYILHFALFLRLANYSRLCFMSGVVLLQTLWLH